MMIGIAEQQKQQIQSVEEAKMNAPVPETSAIDQKLEEELRKMHHTDVNEFDEDQTSDSSEDDIAENSLVKTFGGDCAMRITLQAKLLINISAEPVALPDTIKGGNGFYSVRSPLRKSKDGPLGSARDPSGLVRDSLTSVIEYLAGVNGEKVSFFGSFADIDANVAKMLSYYYGNICEIMYRPFGGSTTVKIESEDGASSADGTLNAAFFLDAWVSHTQDGRDLTLFPVFAINLRVPLLTDTDNQCKAIVNMSRALHNTGEKFGLLDNLVFAYSMDSEDLASPKTLSLFNGLNEAQHPVTVLTVGSVARMSEGGDNLHGIFPLAYRLEDACSKLFPFAKFPFGKDMLLIV